MDWPAFISTLFDIAIPLLGAARALLALPELTPLAAATTLIPLALVIANSPKVKATTSPSLSNADLSQPTLSDVHMQPANPGPEKGVRSATQSTQEPATPPGAPNARASTRHVSVGSALHSHTPTPRTQPACLGPGNERRFASPRSVPPTSPRDSETAHPALDLAALFKLPLLYPANSATAERRHFAAPGGSPGDASTDPSRSPATGMQPDRKEGRSATLHPVLSPASRDADITHSAFHIPTLYILTRQPPSPPKSSTRLPPIPRCLDALIP